MLMSYSVNGSGSVTLYKPLNKKVALHEGNGTRRDSKSWLQQPPRISSPDNVKATFKPETVTVPVETSSETRHHDIKVAITKLLIRLSMVIVAAIPMTLAIIACVASGGIAAPFLVVCSLSLLVALGDACCAAYNLHQVRQGGKPLCDDEDSLCFIIRKILDACGIKENNRLFYAQVISVSLRLVLDLSGLFIGASATSWVHIAQSASSFIALLKTLVSALITTGHKAETYFTLMREQVVVAAEEKINVETARQQAAVLFAAMQEVLTSPDLGELSGNLKMQLEEIYGDLKLFLGRNLIETADGTNPVLA